MRGIYRVIDVSLNRITEGLRVVEDILRFHLDHPLWKQIKDLRLEVAQLIEYFPKAYLRGSRNAEKDPGLRANSNIELDRRSEMSIIDANISRVKEALRAIEECSKLVLHDVEVIKHIKYLRRRIYGIEKSLSIMYERRWLSTMNLYFIADYSILGDNILSVVEDAIKGGTDVIQLRAKHIDDRTFLLVANDVRAITDHYNTPLIIDDRADIAIAVGADGVHLGQNDMLPTVVRRLYGDMLVIGMSVHNTDELAVAKGEGVDYIGIGPVFSSATKGENLKPLGIDGVVNIVNEWHGPYVAIGGINLENIDSVVASGIKAVAVISAIANSNSPYSAAAELKSRLDGVKRDDYEGC